MFSGSVRAPNLKGRLMATKPAKSAESSERGEESTDSPVLDSLTAAVRKLVTRGKERGYVTYDDLNEALPPDEASSEQIEDTMAQLSEMGINVIENEESDEAASEDKAGSAGTEAPAKVEDEDLGRTDDPVRGERALVQGILTLRTPTDCLAGGGARRPCASDRGAAIRGPNRRTPR